mgnify:CR=1 FL=1
MRENSQDAPHKKKKEKMQKYIIYIKKREERREKREEKGEKTLTPLYLFFQDQLYNVQQQHHGKIS